MIEATVDEMYRDDEANRFLEVTYQNGDKEILYYKDFSSGAMIENIVRRAKKLAIKRVIGGGAKGVSTDDLLASIKQEYKEHEDLPNTTNPDDWAKISGKKGERIVFIRTLVNETKGKVTRLFSSRHATHKPTLELAYVVGGQRPRPAVAATVPGSRAPAPRGSHGSEP